jgi:hypothetical protein
MRMHAGLLDQTLLQGLSITTNLKKKVADGSEEAMETGSQIQTSLASALIHLLAHVTTLHTPSVHLTSQQPAEPQPPRTRPPKMPIPQDENVMDVHVQQQCA